MKYAILQYPRGANKGGVLEIDICPTISVSSFQNNCCLIEYENAEKKENRGGEGEKETIWR